MIRQARMSDLPYVNRVMKHPEVCKNTMYDGKIVDFIKHGPPVYVLIDDDNCFVMVFIPINSVMWDSHDNALPEARGKKAVRIGRAMTQWMFNNTPCQKLIGFTPATNPQARMFAQMCGWKLEGTVKKGMLVNNKLEDLLIVGACKE